MAAGRPPCSTSTKAGEGTNLVKDTLHSAIRWNAMAPKPFWSVLQQWSVEKVDGRTGCHSAALVVFMTRTPTGCRCLIGRKAMLVPSLQTPWSRYAQEIVSFSHLRCKSLDYNVIVLKRRHRVSNQAINKANELWIDHLNMIRERRNAYIEDFTCLSGKGRGEALKNHVVEFAKLKDQIGDKVAAVKVLGGTPVPFPDHLKEIPRLG